MSFKSQGGHSSHQNDFSRFWTCRRASFLRSMFNNWWDYKYFEVGTFSFEHQRCYLCLSLLHLDTVAINYVTDPGKALWQERVQGVYKEAINPKAFSFEYEAWEKNRRKIMSSIRVEKELLATWECACGEHTISSNEWFSLNSLEIGHFWLLHAIRGKQSPNDVADDSLPEWNQSWVHKTQKRMSRRNVKTWQEVVPAATPCNDSLISTGAPPSNIQVRANTQSLWAKCIAPPRQRQCRREGQDEQVNKRPAKEKWSHSVPR